MYSWIVRQAMRRMERQLNAGEVDKLVAAFDDDARLFFPGDSSWSGEHRGKPAIRAWLERFTSFKPSFQLHDVAAAGPPWNMRIVTRWHNDLRAKSDGKLFPNRGMQYLRIRFGRVVEDELYEDTQTIARALEHVGA